MTDVSYETIIGLEVHVQLQTRTKMFCRCSTAFGAAPNTQTCPVCIGMPGSLPVMNREAFQLSLRTAVALNCEIPEFTKWDRKNYYYPDLPKGYQISQYDLPMSQHGYLDISDPNGRFQPTHIRILRAHLEEDAGKSMHDEAAGKGDSRIDLNRTGTPLLEIVTEPDLRSPEEAKAFLTELKLLLGYLGVSDCNMQEGSLRVDANVNLHVTTLGEKALGEKALGEKALGEKALGEKIATPIVEVKNMNSFRAVERALTYEVQRQREVWERTGQKLGDIPKQTRGWDEQAQITRGQRHKEESSDYRYFPDPDLVPVIVKPKEVEQVRSALPELPAALRTRLESTYSIDAYDADVLVNQGSVFVHYYESVATQCGDGKRASNWIQQEVLRTLKEREILIESFPIPADTLSQLIEKVNAGDLDNTRAKDVFQQMLTTGESVDQSMKALGIAKVDDSELENLCRSLLEANPKALADIQEGKLKAAGSLIGQAKKQNPNVNPGQVREIVLRLAQEM